MEQQKMENCNTYISHCILFIPRRQFQINLSTDDGWRRLGDRDFETTLGGSGSRQVRGTDKNCSAALLVLHLEAES
jgi:hypothetical protein